jgi:hypothetical protein
MVKFWVDNHVENECFSVNNVPFTGTTFVYNRVVILCNNTLAVQGWKTRPRSTTPQQLFVIVNLLTKQEG